MSKKFIEAIQEAHHSMSQVTTNGSYAVGLDTGVTAELQATSVIGVYEDLGPVVSFVQNDGLTRSLNNMLYFSAANDIGSLTRTTQQVSSILEVTNHILRDNSSLTTAPAKISLLEQVEYLSSAYIWLINNLKLVYKIYGMRKPALVNAITRILQCLVEYNNSSLVSQFTEAFDLNQAAVHNILVPTRDDFEKNIIDNRAMRRTFVDFWISLCSTSSPLVRRALLTNYKVMNNFWKYLEMEKFESLNNIIDFLDQFVCSEVTFKRATKCKILNENFLYNVRLLFSYLKTENDRKHDNDDIHDFKEFKSKFVNFMNTLVSDTNKGIAYPENEFGSTIVVNNVTFKINNKLIYTLLTAMKPWESYVQLQLVMQILNHTHELLPPYMHWLVSNSGGYHEPALSSYWIGHTLLYSEILKSAHLPLKAEFISLLPLSKTALSECITFPSDLVKQLGLQLVLLQLKRLSRSENVSQSMKEFVLSGLPSQATILPLLTHENKLLKLTATSIVAAQEEIAPKSALSSTVGVITKELSSITIRSNLCSSFDLLLLDSYLSIQTNNDLKWWKKVPGGNSFFTTLLRFSKIPELRSKVLKVLKKLTKGTLVFNEERLIDSPLVVLIEASETVGDDYDAIMACLDETIARAIDSPYKYLDKSHNKYSNMSVFLVVLFEQVEFIPTFAEGGGVTTWLEKVLLGMSIIGEPLIGIETAAANSTGQLTLRPTEVKVGGTVTSKFEFARAVSRLNQITDDEAAASETFDLMTSMAQFLKTSHVLDGCFIEFITCPSKWVILSEMGSTSISDRVCLAIYLYHEMVFGLRIDFAGSNLRDFIYNLSLKVLPHRNQVLLRKFISIVSDDQLQKLTKGNKNHLIIIEACHECSKRGIKFEIDLSYLMIKDCAEIHAILRSLTLSGDDVNVIMKHPSFYYLLENSSTKAGRFLMEQNDLSDSLIYQVSPFYPEVAMKFKDRVVALAFTMRNWTRSIRIFTSCSSFFDQSHIMSAVFSNSDSDSKKAMSSEFVQFVSSVSSCSPEIPEPIRVWLQKAILYITKKLAESENLSQSFGEFFKAFQNLIIRQKCMCKVIPVKLLDAQLEVILGSKVWSGHAVTLEYVNRLLFPIEPGLIDSDKLLQVFSNNEKNVLRTLPDGRDSYMRFNASSIIHSLFSMNESASSTMALLESILMLYLGSQRADDLILKDVLKRIEKKLAQSWVDRITNWDYQEDISQEELEIVGEERLFIKESSSFVVALNKKFVKRAIESGVSCKDIPKQKTLESFHSFFLSCPSGSYQETIYDPEFLMLLLINNEELVKETDKGIRFDLSKLIDSGLLRLVITSLAVEKVRDIAKIILSGVMMTLCSDETSFKDKGIMKVFVSSIMHTTKVCDHSVSLVWFVVGSLSTILTNPGHFLYEQAHRYILSTPIFKPSGIPLITLITSASPSEDSLEDDDHHRPISWLVAQMIVGVKTVEDLNLLNSRKVLESILNLYNSAFTPTRLKTSILNLIYAIQAIGNEGSDMLITKFAGLTSVEALSRLAMPESAVGLQEKLNVCQVALRLGALRRRKRIAEWSSSNIDGAMKRTHLA